MPYQRTLISRYWQGLVLLAFSLLIAVFTYQDYGISWDEPEQRYMGEVSYNYIFKGDTTLKHFEDRDHGVGFELGLTGIENHFNITDSRDIYLMRHLVTHIFFLLCVFAGYVLIQRLFGNPMLSCLGFLLLAFHPRIYAHSFFNSKDLPFLGVFLLCLMVAQIAFQKNKGWQYALLGICCGYAISIRILGIMLVGLFTMFLLIDMVTAIIEKGKPSKSLLNLLLFIASSVAMLYAAWPVLWGAPVSNFMGIYTRLSHFPWTGSLLFAGKEYTGQNLPWFYLPGWFCITVPVVWLLGGVAGILLLVVAFFRKPLNYLKNYPNRNFLLYLLCFTLPLIAIIKQHSVVYDDWRHVYFIYPPFVLLCLYALSRIPPGSVRWVAYGICFAQVAATGIYMCACHPLSQTYFNNLVSHKEESLRKNYDLDYWGCSYKQGLEYILAHDTSSVIKIEQGLLPLKNNLKILPADQRQRIQLSAPEDHPDYFITNFREHPADYLYPKTFYEIKLQNTTILRVYKLH